MCTAPYTVRCLRTSLDCLRRHAHAPVTAWRGAKRASVEFTADMCMRKPAVSTRQGLELYANCLRKRKCCAFRLQSGMWQKCPASHAQNRRMFLKLFYMEGNKTDHQVAEHRWGRGRSNSTFACVPPHHHVYRRAKAFTAPSRFDAWLPWHYWKSCRFAIVIERMVENFEINSTCQVNLLQDITCHIQKWTRVSLLIYQLDRKFVSPVLATIQNPNHEIRTKNI